MIGSRPFLVYVALCCALLVLPLFLVETGKHFANVRNWQILLNAAAIFAVASGRIDVARDVEIPRSLKAAFVASVGISFASVALLHYWAFEVNGIDFSTFDWMLYNAWHRDFMTSPICDCNHMGVHPMWVLAPLVPLHHWVQSPLFSVLLHPLILWSAIFPLWRLGRHYLKSEVLTFLLVMAYVTGSRTGTVLNHSFHPEALYVPVGLYFVWGWVTERRWVWVLAAATFLATKEDGALYLAGFAGSAMLFESSRRRSSALLLVVCVVLFLVNIRVVQPYFLASIERSEPGYVAFWGRYGRTLPAILIGMAREWPSVLRDVFSGGWIAMVAAAAGLPLLAPQAMLSLAPAIFIHSTSANEHMRGLHAYYAASVLAFFFWALVQGYARLPAVLSTLRLSAKAPSVMAVILLGMCLVGGDYMRFPAPRWDAVDGLKRIEEEVLPPTRIGTSVCVQTILFPHLPYEHDLKPLTSACLGEQSIILVNPSLSPYPHTTEELRGMIARASAEGRPVREYPGGFLVLN